MVWVQETALNTSGKAPGKGLEGRTASSPVYAHVHFHVVLHATALVPGPLDDDCHTTLRDLPPIKRHPTL
eukprot:356256-Chlamydomonas_euryale.AAC.1